ncbi:MAG: serine/threonine protein kinase [Cyanobacteria bacterium SZAS LIN-3]|nr:serine/threonine protein kinase [Cyanobacteria bacterium SZAS LIN-3]
MSNRCEQCGKQRADGEKAGSLTSYLFSPLRCSCGRDSARPTGGFDDERKFCPLCGLLVVPSHRLGSLTSFLFQSTRCKCLPKDSRIDKHMSVRFRKLKLSSADKTFVSGGDRSPGVAGRVDLAPGAVIAGTYLIRQKLGQGGMGEVYLAKHQALGRKCAIKVIPPDQVNEMGWTRFQLEAKVVAKLEHKNLVRVTDLGIHENCLPFYAMDYIDGKDLSELLALNGPMALEEVLDIFIQVCDGVECAHRAGVLHRDLKPANIMVRGGENGRHHVSVLDFGLAKLVRQDRAKQSLTTIGDVFGSPYYMSPEQCRGERIDHRSDIYSIGCTMFECLTGRPPFDGNIPTAVMFSHMEAPPPTLRSVRPDLPLPESIDVVMTRLLRKDPAQRYQWLSELRADLELVAAGYDVEPVELLPSSLAKDWAAASEPPAKSGAINFALIAGACLLVFGLGAVVVSFAFSMFASKPVAKAATSLKPASGRADPARSGTINGAVDLEKGLSEQYINDYSNSPSVDESEKIVPFKCKAAFRGIEMHNGIRCKHFSFPPGKSFKQVLLLASGDWPNVRATPVSDEVFVPADKHLTLITTKLERETVDRSGLRDGDFDELYIRGRTPANFYAAMRALGDFKLINSFCFGGVLWQVDYPDYPPGLVAQLKHQSNLTRLVAFAPISPEFLMGTGAVSKFRDLRLFGLQPDFRKVFQLIGTMSNLETFFCDGWGLPNRELAGFASCPKLTRLFLGLFTGTHEQLAILKECRNLQILEVPDLRYRSDLAADLAAMPALKEVRFLVSARMPGAEVEELQRALPKIKFRPYMSPQELHDCLEEP